MRSRGASNEIESSAWVGRSISLNDVIRSPQERRRHRQPKRLRCFQVEDQLGEAIEQRGFGEYDGDEHGPTETTFFMYGPDAERLYSGIEPVLRAYPLCQNARVIIRRSGRS